MRFACFKILPAGHRTTQTLESTAITSRSVWDYFDTTTGGKTDSRSYQDIAESLQRLPSEIVFISDVTTELDAAKSAGTQALLSMRPGNRSQPATVHPLIRTLDEVFP